MELIGTVILVTAAGVILAPKATAIVLGCVFVAGAIVGTHLAERARG
jgi:hypothetical protein